MLTRVRKWLDHLFGIDRDQLRADLLALKASVERDAAEREARPTEQLPPPRPIDVRTPASHDVRPVQGADGVEWVLWRRTPGDGYREAGRFASEDDARRALAIATRDPTSASAFVTVPTPVPACDPRNLTVDVGEGVGVRARVG